MMHYSLPPSSEPQLLDEHIADLAASGIDGPTALRSGVSSMTHQEVHDFGIRGEGNLSGLGFKYWEPGTSSFSQRFVRVKPTTAVNGRKYLQPVWEAPRLYFLCGTTTEQVADGASIVLITEGEKKTIALDAAARKEGINALAIGLGGCWSWRQSTMERKPDGTLGKGRSKAIADLDLISWAGRVVYVLFDSDVLTNRAIAKAESALACEINRRGANVRIVRVPPLPGLKKSGIDDFLRHRGSTGLQHLLDQAEPLASGRGGPGSASANDRSGQPNELVSVDEPVLHASELKRFINAGLNDMGNSQRLAIVVQEKFRYCPQWSAWFYFDGTRWKEDHEELKITAAAKSMVRLLKRESVGLERNESMASWARQSAARARLNAAVDLARSEPGISVSYEEFDKDPWLLNCPNGTIDLRTGRCRAHAPQDLVRKMTGVAFDLASPAPRFERFLVEILPDSTVRAFVQRAIGYAATGVVRERVVFMFCGGGRNGKSLLLRLISEALGDYATTTSPTLLLETKGDRHPTEGG
jgi:hypothetical protein